MIKSLYKIVVLISLLSFTSGNLFVNEVHACSCVSTSIDRIISISNYIFIGKVLKFSDSDGDEFMTMEVQEVLKGFIVSKQIEVYAVNAKNVDPNAPSVCGGNNEGYLEGHTYLINSSSIKNWRFVPNNAPCNLLDREIITGNSNIEDANKNLIKDIKSHVATEVLTSISVFVFIIIIFTLILWGLKKRKNSITKISDFFKRKIRNLL